MAGTCCLSADDATICVGSGLLWAHCREIPSIQIVQCRKSKDSSNFKPIIFIPNISVCIYIYIYIYPVQHLRNFEIQVLHEGARGSVVVKVLCYKPEGHGFDIR
jgi:hypothetical protein